MTLAPTASLFPAACVGAVRVVLISASAVRRFGLAFNGTNPGLLAVKELNSSHHKWDIVKRLVSGYALTASQNPGTSMVSALVAPLATTFEGGGRKDHLGVLLPLARISNNGAYPWTLIAKGFPTLKSPEVP